MNYLKIAELANEGNIISQKISEYYALIGANRHYSVEVCDSIYAAIKVLDINRVKIDDKLRKLIDKDS